MKLKSLESHLDTWHGYDSKAAKEKVSELLNQLSMNVSNGVVEDEEKLIEFQLDLLENSSEVEFVYFDVETTGFIEKKR